MTEATAASQTTRSVEAWMRKGGGPVGAGTRTGATMIGERLGLSLLLGEVDAAAGCVIRWPGCSY